MKLIKFLILPILLLAFFQVAYSVNAQTLNTASSVADRPTKAAVKADIRASASAAKQARKDALSDLKVKACEARQAGIIERSDLIVKRATKKQEVFAKIAARVEQFYQTKLLLQGKIVANYDGLVSDITTKSAAIAPLLVQAQSDAVNFSCDNDRPAEQVQTFNKDMRAVMSALEAYRKSVRTLIVAVKGVTGAEHSATNSAKPVTVQ